MGKYNIYALERGFDISNGIENEQRVYGYFNNWNDISQYITKENKKELSPIFKGFFTLKEAEMTYKDFPNKTKKAVDKTCLRFQGNVYTDIQSFREAVIMSNDDNYIKVII